MSGDTLIAEIDVSKLVSSTSEPTMKLRWNKATGCLDQLYRTINYRGGQIISGSFDWYPVPTETP